MQKLVVCFFVMLFTLMGVYSQTGFTGPQGSTGNYGHGFTGPSQTVTLAQASSFFHKTPVVVVGTIVQAIGADRYLFRDSSGEIVLKIGPKEWYYFGTTISPTETIEISGEVHRDKKNWQRPPEIHARSIRKL